MAFALALALAFAFPAKGASPVGGRALDTTDAWI
jgi:hypothetical protein